MNSFIFIGRTFFNQTVDFVREIKKQAPDSKCTMLVAARSDTLDTLNSYKDLEYAQLDWLSTYEQEWLDTPLDEEKRALYEKKFGTAALRAIITADRELSIGFVSGGVYAETPLMKACLDDDNLRWRYVIGLLDYLYTTFEHDKPKFAFIYCVASAIGYAMALVAKDLGVLFVQPVPSRIDHHYVLDNNLYNTLVTVQKTFAEAKKNPDIIAAHLPKAEEYINMVRNKYEVPVHTNKMRNDVTNQAKIIGMLKTLCIDLARWGAIALGLEGTKGVLRQRKGWAILLENFKVFQVSRKVLKGKVFDEVDLNEVGSYIYFPLHVDPEASTMVLADQYTDQMFIIETIAKNMPANMKLLVKEHIPCIGRRPDGYYERISRMPDVKLVSPFMNSAELTKNSSVLFTITGTAAFEAIILGKPSVIMGHAHFTNIGEGFVKCNSIAQIGDTIKAALKVKKAQEEHIKLYIATLYKESTYLPEDFWYDSDIASARNTSQDIISKIDALIKESKNEAGNVKAKAA